MLNKAYEKLLGYSQREAREIMDLLRPVPVFTHARSDHLVGLHRIGMRMRLGHLAVTMASVNKQICTREVMWRGVLFSNSHGLVCIYLLLQVCGICASRRQRDLHARSRLPTHR